MPRIATDYRKLAGRFTPVDLPGQWLIATDTRLVPQGWQSTRLGDLHVAWSAPLPCTELQGNGATSSVILGWYIGSDGVLLGNVNRPSMDEPDGLDGMLGSLAGNFVCLVASGADVRLYLDACGSLSALYSEERRCISSNIFLIPEPNSSRDNRKYADRFDIPASDCMFPVGMTPRTDIERLLPNHYLDLKKWKAVRYWPNGQVTDTTNVEETVRQIGDLVARNISAVAQVVPVQMSLTAGRDSRMLLACARHWAGEASFFTYALPDRTGKLDVHLAERLAERLHLRHKVLPFVASGQSDGEKWLYRTGASVGERRGFEAMRTTMQLDSRRAYLPGLVAELARGYYWHLARHIPSLDDRDGVSRVLLRAINAPIDEQTTARLSTWVAGLPAVDILGLLDFFYLEQRLGCWAGIVSYAYADMVRFESWPLNSRRLVRLMLSLPRSYRAAARVNDDIIRMRWPELAQFPYNKGDLPFRVVDALAYYPVEVAWKVRRKVRRTLQATVGQSGSA